MSVNSRDRREDRRPAIEWIFGSVSATVVLGLVLFLGYEAIFGQARPAELVVSIEQVIELESGTLVAVSVVNRGDQTAAAVTVHAFAPDGSGGTVQKQLEFDYVAAHATRHGAFVFSMPVVPEALHFQVGGYVDP